MRCFTQYLDPTPREEMVIPPSVQNYIYRSSNTGVTHPLSKRRAPRTMTSVNTKRRTARGVVFDTTLSPQSNSAKSVIEHVSTEGTRTVELAAKKIYTIPRTKECRVSMNQVANHAAIVEDKLQTDEVGFSQGVSHKKKRKLPQTLL